MTGTRFDSSRTLSKVASVAGKTTPGLDAGAPFAAAGAPSAVVGWFARRTSDDRSTAPRSCGPGGTLLTGLRYFARGDEPLREPEHLDLRARLRGRRNVEQQLD